MKSAAILAASAAVAVAATPAQAANFDDTFAAACAAVNSGQPADAEVGKQVSDYLRVRLVGKAHHFGHALLLLDLVVFLARFACEGHLDGVDMRGGELIGVAEA